MTEIVCLNGSEGLLSEQSLLRVINSFVPPAILEKTRINQVEAGDDNDGHRLVTKVLDKSDNHLRMYGTVEELHADLNRYRNVTNDHRVFGYDYCEPYSRIPTVYESTKGDSYVAKADVFVHLQNLILKKCEIIRNHPFAISFLSTFLKVNEGRLKDTNEYTMCSDDEFKVMEMDLMEALMENSKTPKLKIGTHEEIFIQFKSILKNWDKAKFQKIEVLLADLVKSNPPKEFPKLYEDLYTTISKLVSALNAIFRENPMIFDPQNTKQIPEGNRNKADHSSCVRLGAVKFIPKDSYFPIMGRDVRNLRVYPGIWETYHDDSGLNEMFEEIEENDRNIMIYVPIVRTKYTGAYVFDSKAIPHKLALDVFFEFFAEWVFGLKLFQRLKSEKEFMENIGKFLSQSGDFFNPKREHPYFIADSFIKSTRVIARKIFGAVLNRPAKNICEVGPEGFSKEKLAHELERLGVNTIFPDILFSSRFVYDRLLQNKKGEPLKTSDLHEAIFQSQLIAFLRKSPTLFNFIHFQEGCHRVFTLACVVHLAKLETDPNKKREHDLLEKGLREIVRDSFIVRQDEAEEAASSEVIITQNSNDSGANTVPSDVAERNKTAQEIQVASMTENLVNFLSDERKKPVKGRRLEQTQREELKLLLRTFKEFQDDLPADLKKEINVIEMSEKAKIAKELKAVKKQLFEVTAEKDELAKKLETSETKQKVATMAHTEVLKELEAVRKQLFDVAAEKDALANTLKKIEKNQKEQLAAESAKQAQEQNKVKNDLEATQRELLETTLKKNALQKQLEANKATQMDEFSKEREKHEQAKKEIEKELEATKKQLYEITLKKGDLAKKLEASLHSKKAEDLEKQAEAQKLQEVTLENETLRQKLENKEKDTREIQEKYTKLSVLYSQKDLQIEDLQVRLASALI